MEPAAIILKLHTAEELVFYSNIAHWIEGGIFIVVVALAFIQRLNRYQAKWLEYSWPALILGAGLFLPIFSFSHHLDELALAWQATIFDPQQRQHFYIAILMTIAGIAEISNVKTNRQQLWLGLIFPFALLIIGFLFLTHPQHGTSEAVMRATTIHQYLGTVLILSGIFKAIDKRYRFAWMIFLLIAAGLLISYREPEGAYMPEYSSQIHMQHQ